MPYVVAFGIILAVLSIFALSRRAEDDAFLTEPSFTRGAASAGGGPKKAARTARPPELSPQASGSGQSSPLICLCPHLVVPEKVECTLMVPQVSGLVSRGATVPVADVKGGPIFLLEVLADGQMSDGTRQALCAEGFRVLDAQHGLTVVSVLLN